ncbi:MAG: PGPGW domain-containing protein [Candidatus Saccharimonadales bacterium]
MESFKRNWKRIPPAVRKPLVAMVGTLLIILGLLLVPLPGPGWLVVFGGLAVLATEFAVAEKARAWLIDRFQLIWNKAKKKL